MESKEFHFSAVAEYRESLVEYEARRYAPTFRGFFCYSLHFVTSLTDMVPSSLGSPQRI